MKSSRGLVMFSSVRGTAGFGGTLPHNDNEVEIIELFHLTTLWLVFNRPFPVTDGPPSKIRHQEPTQ
jgi:hypothetical protein